jgi:hypothetical protein
MDNENFVLHIWFIVHNQIWLNLPKEDCHQRFFFPSILWGWKFANFPRKRVNFIEIKLEKQIGAKLCPEKVAKKKRWAKFATFCTSSYGWSPRRLHKKFLQNTKKHCAKQDQKRSREVKQILMLQDSRIPL